MSAIFVRWSGGAIVLAGIWLVHRQRAAAAAEAASPVLDLANG